MVYTENSWMEGPKMIGRKENVSPASNMAILGI